MGPPGMGDMGCPPWGTQGTNRRASGLPGLDRWGVAAQWDTYFLEPLALGGAARFSASVVDPVSGLQADSVRAFIGPVAATSATDTNVQLMPVDLASAPVGMPWIQTLFGAPRLPGLTLSWFASFGGVWEAGPVVTGVDLSPQGTSEFPWILDWLVDRLQESAQDRPLASNRNLLVRRTYPRDTTGWPMLSVQVDSVSPTGQMLGESEGAAVGGTRDEGRVYSVSISLVGWCDQPEDRSLVGQWLIQSLTPILDVAAYAGMSEPSFTVEESEDFETIGVPAFLSTARFTCLVESRWNRPVRSGYGRVTV